MHRLSLSLLLASAAAVAACQQEPAAGNEADEEPVLNLPSVPKPRPPIDRAALLAAAVEASSAMASGIPMPQSVRSLDGRQFEIRIRFGCRGPVTDLNEHWLGWSFDPEERRIRVRAMPTISSDEPLVEGIGDERIEAVEGFFIPRPWLMAPVCPAGAAVQRSPAEEKPEADAEEGDGAEEREQRPEQVPDEPPVDRIGEPVPTAPRIGIAQFFTTDDPRSRRRDMRPYRAAYSLKEGEALSSQGYNLVLSGRLRALTDRGIIHCTARGPDSPPECIVSAEFLRVWIEKPDTREVIAEWGGG